MKNLEPKGLWSSFYSLTQIPRPSGKRKEIADFLVNYGKSLGMDYGHGADDCHRSTCY